MRGVMFLRNNMRLRIKPRYICALLLLIIASIGLLYVIDLRISSAAEEAIFTNVERVPEKSAALVLGTAKYAFGRKNLFYLYRLDAAERLFKAGKVRAIVVSGDNSRKDYDEPTNMKNDLIKRGIPGKYITIDYAGFRTLDSIIRAKEVFSLDDYIIVSQFFHCERALYIAKKAGHKAIAFSARDVASIGGLKVRLREIFARCKAFLDISLLGTTPKFLGRKEKVYYKET